MWSLGRFLGLLLAIPLVLAARETPESIMESNQKRLDKLRIDPEQYQRLVANWQSFKKQSPARQQQLRQLDQQLHDLDRADLNRLWAVLDRYHSWLEKQEPDVRKRLTASGDPSKRLALLKEIRRREWVEMLPSSVRDKWQKLPADQQEGKLQEIREEQERIQQLWRRGAVQPNEPTLRPSTLRELPAEVRAYLDELMPRLSAEEKDRLKQSEGKWPDLPRTIRELSEAHPNLPPLRSGPITKWSDLPGEVRQSLELLDRRKVKQVVRQLPARWPEFALEVHRIIQREGLTSPPLGASNIVEMPPEVQRAMKDILYPRLGPMQRETLRKLEGRWPEFPLTLLRFAREKGVSLPGMSPPGPPELWE
ncbi:MAG: hypothetical protein ACKO23_04050 [Gemmataceae bacterium]